MVHLAYITKGLAGIGPTYSTAMNIALVAITHRTVFPVSCGTRTQTHHVGGVSQLAYMPMGLTISPMGIGPTYSTAMNIALVAITHRTVFPVSCGTRTQTHHVGGVSQLAYMPMGLTISPMGLGPTYSTVMNINMVAITHGTVFPVPCGTRTQTHHVGGVSQLAYIYPWVWTHVLSNIQRNN